MFLAEGSGDGLGVATKRRNKLFPLIRPLGSSARLRSAREAVPGAREVSGGSKVSQEACEILLFPDADPLRSFGQNALLRVRRSYMWGRRINVRGTRLAWLMLFRLARAVTDRIVRTLRSWVRENLLETVTVRCPASMDFN